MSLCRVITLRIALLMPRMSGLAVNFILIESLQRFHQFYGDEIEVRHDVENTVKRRLTVADRWSARLGVGIT